jgi:hypothetical protein
MLFLPMVDINIDASSSYTRKQGSVEAFFVMTTMLRSFEALDVVSPEKASLNVASLDTAFYALGCSILGSSVA